MIEATLAVVYDAGQVRLAQLGTHLLSLLADSLPVSDTVRAISDLRFGLETAAQLPAGAEQDAVVGYLIETYGLLAVGTDPFLRPLLPPVPGTGAAIRYKVRAANGHASGANGNYILAGAALVPAIL